MTTLPIPSPEENNFLTVNGFQRSHRGFTVKLLLEHLREHLLHPQQYVRKDDNKGLNPSEILSGEYCTLKCGCRTFMHRVSPENMLRMRIRFRQASGKALDRDKFIIKSYGGKHSALLAIKLCDENSSDDILLAKEQRNAEAERGEIFGARLAKCDEIIDRYVSRMLARQVNE